MKDLLGYDKVDIAIKRMQEFEPPEGLYLAFSGGKDSIVLKKLADMAGVKYDAHMSLTTVDPIEVLHYIKDYHPDVYMDKPKKSMWQLILDNHMPPTRLARFCCRELKEVGGMNRLCLTGIRAEESNQRKKRSIVEQCRSDPRKRYLHPIIDWTKDEIWQFIYNNHLPYCSLYDEGFDRIGCVLCPMTSNKKFQIKRFPKFYRAYMHTFDKLVKTYDVSWKTAQEVMDWWLSDKSNNTDDKGLFT